MGVLGPHSTPWTAAEIERLRLLWRSGWPAGRIAADLGKHRSRNSVLSKAHRLGLAVRGSPVPPPKPGPAPGQVARTRPKPLEPRGPMQKPLPFTPDREPCRRCGAAGVNGCEHRQPSQPAPALTSRWQPS